MKKFIKDFFFKSINLLIYFLITYYLCCFKYKRLFRYLFKYDFFYGNETTFWKNIIDEKNVISKTK